MHTVRKFHYRLHAKALTPTEKRQNRKLNQIVKLTIRTVQQNLNYYSRQTADDTEVEQCFLQTSEHLVSCKYKNEYSESLQKLKLTINVH